MSKPITKTHMSGFRGATSAFELELDPSKDITMLFGENGSGKSTILDAIDVVCNETIGCLEGVSVGQAPGRYLCTLGSQPASLQVTVHSNGESWTGTMRRNAITVSGGGDRPCVKILRRNKILELVTAQPSDRYRALSRFIDIGVVEQSESNLQQKLNGTNQEITILTRDKDRMATQLDELWNDEGRPGPGLTAMAWAEERVNTGIQGLNDKLAQLKAVVEVVAAATAAKTEYESRNEKHSNVAGQLAGVNQQIANAPSITSATAVQLLESLEKAKAYIEADDSLDKCPTCQRPMGRDELLGIVNQEFDQLSELKTLTNNRQRIQGWVNTAASHLGEAKAALVGALKKVQEVVQAGDVPELVALNIAWPSWEQATDDMDALVAICFPMFIVMIELLHILAVVNQRGHEGSFSPPHQGNPGRIPKLFQRCKMGPNQAMFGHIDAGAGRLGRGWRRLRVGAGPGSLQPGRRACKALRAPCGCAHNGLPLGPDSLSDWVTVLVYLSITR